MLLYQFRSYPFISMLYNNYGSVYIVQINKYALCRVIAEPIMGKMILLEIAAGWQLHFFLIAIAAGCGPTTAVVCVQVLRN